MGNLGVRLLCIVIADCEKRKHILETWEPGWAATRNPASRQQVGGPYRFLHLIGRQRLSEAGAEPGTIF